MYFYSIIPISQYTPPCQYLNMAKINDVSSSEIKLSSALNRLRKADILDKDKQDIEDFYFSLRRANLKKETQINYLNCLKKTCEYYKEISVNKPLRDIELRDFDKLLFYLEEELHRKDWTINVYKNTFRKYMKWAHGNNLPHWITTELKLKKVLTRVQPDDIPTREEFTAFVNCASSPRDKAIIAVAGDAGVRISALLSCTISSFVENQHAAILYLNPSGPLKTTPPKGIPLTWSTAYVQSWLANHPLRNDPKAPLWTTNVRKRKDPKNPKSLEFQALSYSACYKMFVAVESRLNSNKHIHPHKLRHYAVTNWILDGLPEQIIKHRAGWGPDSKELGRYGNWTDSDLNTQIYEIYGLKKEDKRSIELKTCPRCTNILKPGDRFCSRCSLCLDHSAFNSIETGENITMGVRSVLEKFGLWDELNRLQQKGESGPKKTNDKKDLTKT